MRSRQTLVDLFSTFVQFEADAFRGWISDPKLRRSMEQLIKSATEDTSERFWVLYWHKSWHTQPTHLATNHITAYLQETCYWVARKMTLNLASRQSTADLFQTAIARISHVLKGFNPQFSSNLKSYAEFAFSNVIKDTLRQQQEADICTDWALLQKVSQKRLVDSLTHAGIDAQTIAAYGLAWKCFKEKYAPNDRGTARKLVKPDGATWQAIAQLYNAERSSQLNSKIVGSPDQVEQWLLSAARAVRVFLYPAPISIDAPLAGQDNTELVDFLPNTAQESLLATMIAQEEVSDRQMQQIQLSQVISTAIAQLETPMQEILQSYYGQQMTQQETSQLLNVPQYTISRRLASLKKTLLIALARWSQETLHISITSDVLSSMSAVLEEWLTVHYQPSDRS
ncbi:sigma-70 family RNA polymerase sigma factor [Phormidium sp. CLA17]|uniref:sigma-70 family RNA polymerase sigma factor n=1 Tax=Leptolyngbya sp. Cla-17 TaxID=2803751 RepID=UPI00149172F2|nr:sigma-70 family RNA polymerase sigma factor [Leptolyngbya sp. Cla-17]MBM0740911.1 sigma-70 family RNA polymerase sigma factor [Leptolyngbya sp. Cla-17]